MLEVKAMGNVNIIGFSLTGFGELTSFGKLLEHALRERGWPGEVREISYGGLSVNALAGLISGAAAPVQSGDTVGLELATSFFSQQKYKYSDALPLVYSIAKYFADRGDVNLFFLNLFREDLDDNDCVVQAISVVVNYFNIPVLDLKKPFRDKLEGFNFVAADGVHPDEDTRRVIALELEKFLCGGRLGGPLKSDGLPDAYSYVDLSDQVGGTGKYRYEGRGKSIESSVVLSGSSLKYCLDTEAEIVGICFLYGPETGFLNVMVDGAEPIELITFDEMSFYRRVGFRPVNKIGRCVEISVPEKTRPVELKRKTSLKVESRREFVCGLVVKSRDFKLPSCLI